MQPVFVIVNSNALASSLARYCKYVLGLEAIRIPFLSQNSSIRQHEWVLQTFLQIAGAIEMAGEQHGGFCQLRNALGFIDLDEEYLLSVDELNPISRECGAWPAVVAMLVLTFPEIHWVLNTPYQPIDSFLFKEVHTLDGTNTVCEIFNLHRQGFTTLFDPTGWRSTIRGKMKLSEEKNQSVAPYIPVRLEVAASLDEEEDYAYLNAYAAYRFGFRCHVLTSYAVTKRVLDGEITASHDTATGMSDAEGNPGVQANRPEKQNGSWKEKNDPDISLVFEDLYLNFPDKSPEVELHFSILLDRDSHFRKLQKVPHRVFVTVGHSKREVDQDTWIRNRKYLQNLQDEGKHCKTVYKPGAGIFDLWSRSGLKQRLKKNGGQAMGFDWPPREAASMDLAGGHSAPGRLLLIATQLIHRADRILLTARSVPEALHGAVLALEAQEYLGHRTPTTSLEALALKHQLEVLAECMFYGVEYNMDVAGRFDEIRREVKSIGEWFKIRTRELSKLNAEIRILSELLSTFRAHNQFDEEQKALVRIRHLHRQLWFKRHGWWAKPFYPVRWYIEFLLRSSLNFVLAIFFWLIFLALLFNHYRHGDITPGPVWWHGFVDAMVSFIGLSPPHDLKEIGKNGAIGVCVFAISLGFIHLGIFISHLYSMMARK